MKKSKGFVSIEMGVLIVSSVLAALLIANTLTNFSDKVYNKISHIVVDVQSK